MDLRSAPLRKVVSTSGGIEKLECGHEHETTYRKAKRRRCRHCVRYTESCQQNHPLDTYETIREVKEPEAEVKLVSISESELPEASTAPRCAYCHDDLDNKVTACPKCRTVVHRDCAKELGGMCPILGCKSRLNQSATEAAMTPRVIKLQIAPRPSIAAFVAEPSRRTAWAVALAALLFVPRLAWRAMSYLWRHV